MAQRPSLDDIGRTHNTDKVSGLHDYLSFYERRLAHLRETKGLLLMEVGVLNGGSLATWKEYLPSATIVGMDITPSCKQYEQGNAHVRIGDVADIGFLFSVINEFGRPNVFVDDGSHRWDHQIHTLQVVFPLLQPGGFFIMEDIDTSFQEHLEKAPFNGRSSISAVDYLHKFSRVVIGERALMDEKPFDMFIEDWSPWVGTIEFGRRTCVISKKERSGGGPI